MFFFQLPLIKQYVKFSFIRLSDTLHHVLYRIIQLLVSLISLLIGSQLFLGLYILIFGVSYCNEFPAVFWYTNQSSLALSGISEWSNSSSSSLQSYDLIITRNLKSLDVVYYVEKWSDISNTWCLTVNFHKICTVFYTVHFIL